MVVVFSCKVVSDSLQLPRTAARWVSLSPTVSRGLLKLMSTELLRQVTDVPCASVKPGSVKSDKMRQVPLKSPPKAASAGPGEPSTMVDSPATAWLYSFINLSSVSFVI